MVQQKKSSKEITDTLHSPQAGIYFYDDFMLDRAVQVERIYFKPKRLSEIYYDPDFNLTYPVVHWCPEIEKYRSWYEIIYNQKTKEKGDYFLLALAESDDAVHWVPGNNCGSTDPMAKEIPRVVYSGLGEVHGAYVMRDEQESNPAWRYKCSGASARNRNLIHSDCIVAVSPDGIHWDELQHALRWGLSSSDTNNCMFYNKVRNVYQIIHRAAMTDRRIHSTTSSDLINWSPPELIIHPDPFDPPCCQLYGMSVYPANGIFMGILYVYHTDMFEPCGQRLKGYQTMELIYSYDGSHWNRTHQTLFDQREYPSPEAGNIYVTGMDLNKDGSQLLLTCICQNNEHGLPDWSSEKRQRMGMGMYSIRPDGFVGLRSVGQASLETKAIRVMTPGLFLNINACMGKVEVQLTDWDETPIPGYTFEENIPCSENSLEYSVKWKDKDMSDLVGRIVRIQIRMNTAILYAIHGFFNPHHAAVAQESIGNPKPVFDGLTKNPDKKWWLKKTELSTEVFNSSKRQPSYDFRSFDL